MMKMIKENFLKTELGSELENCIMVWDNAIEERRKATPGCASDSYKGLGYQYWEKTCTHCQAQWEVYKMVLLQLLGTEYHFARTDEYFGLVTKDEIDWLMKVER